MHKGGISMNEFSHILCTVYCVIIAGYCLLRSIIASLNRRSGERRMIE